MSFAERILTAVWLSATTLSFLASLWVPSPGARLFLDNTSWTLAFWLSAFWAWRGWRQAPPTDRALHTVLLSFAVLVALGQMVWNVQVALDWNPFPAPADLLFLAGGPLWAATVIRATVARLSRDRAYPEALDFGGTVLALLAFTLVIYRLGIIYS